MGQAFYEKMPFQHLDFLTPGSYELNGQLMTEICYGVWIWACL